MSNSLQILRVVSNVVDCCTARILNIETWLRIRYRQAAGVSEEDR